MSRLLIVVTRQNGDSEIDQDLTDQSNELYSGQGLFQVGNERRIWVIPKRDNNGINKTYAQLLEGLEINGELGVVIHNDATGWNGHGIIVALTGEYKCGHYTTPETDKYAAHKALGHCVSRVAEGNAEELFDKFWNLCFSDPILEDIIRLLKTHALLKARNEAAVSLDELKSATIEEFGEISSGSIDGVNAELGAGNTYTALRTALVNAVVKREAANRGE